MPLLFVFGLAAAFVTGYLYQFSFFSQTIPIVDWVIIFLFISSALSRPAVIVAKFTRFRFFLIPLVLFLLWSLLTLVISRSHWGHPGLTEGFMYWLRFAIYSLFPLALLTLSKTILPRIFLLLILLTTAIGLFQYFFFPDIRPLEIFNWDPHFYRVVGSFLDPGFTAIILALGLIYLTLRPLRPLWPYLVLWAATYFAFALTYSRSGFLALYVALVALAWIRRSFVYFVTITLLFLLTLVALPRSSDGEGVKLERTSSIIARLQNWNHTFRIFIDYPVFGVGFNTYRFAQKDYGFISASDWKETHAGAGSDSSLLLVAATTGFLGLGLYLWYFSRIFASAGQLLRLSLVALFVHSWFLNSLFYPFVMVWIAMLVSLRDCK